MNWLIIGLFKYLIKYVQKSQKNYLLLIIFKSIDKIFKKMMWFYIYRRKYNKIIF